MPRIAKRILKIKIKINKPSEWKINEWQCGQTLRLQEILPSSNFSKNKMIFIFRIAVS